MTPWALVPVKDTADAKQRLSAILTASERQSLALHMLQDVLAALAGSRALAGIALVTTDPSAKRFAREIGARVIEDGARDGHTGAVLAGLQALMRSGVEAVVTLPLDVPLVTSAEIDRLVDAHDRDRPAFTIAPAHDRLGSNAILQTPPDAVPPRFGDDSFYPHLTAARRMGIEPTIVPLPGLGLDLDHPADLTAFMRVESSTLTRGFLDSVPAIGRLREPAGQVADA